MNKKAKFFMCFMCLIVFLSAHFVRAIELQLKDKIIIPDRISEAIKIDADLNENVWTKTALTEEFVSYRPVYGEVLPYKTEVWMAYDSKNLYFAFKCYDPEPNKIKTSIAKRDSIFNDDWVAVLIDAMGNKQTSYEFYVNPNGIQGDNLFTTVGGGLDIEPDSAPDFVWESAGKITENGYQIEMCIPLDSIRCRSGKEVKMGILLLRHITKLGIGGTWPETEPGQTDFNFMATIIYQDLKPTLKLEVLPNFVVSREAERESVDEWAKDTPTNIGAAVKFGITSSITGEATIYPDFSQVESDAFQVEVNRRYPIFNTEKRPFFMEGMDHLNFGPSFDEGMMIAPVHTRNIMDPSWAAKVSGASGKLGFVALAANDKAPGQPWEGGINPDEGKDALWGIVRAKYNIGSDNSLGVLYSGRHFAGAKNDVAGVDCQYRFFTNLRLNASYFSSRTTESAGDQVKIGNGINARLDYLVPKLEAFAIYERYDNDFNMASSFMNRTNISSGFFFIGPNFYTKVKGMPWLKKFQPFFEYTTVHDFDTKMDDMGRSLGMQLHFTRDAIFRCEVREEDEGWFGQLYNSKFFHAFARVQLYKWLFLQSYYRIGDQIYYGPQTPFLGTGYLFRMQIMLQPSARFNMRYTMYLNDIYSKADEINQREKRFEVDVFNLSSTYQFNKYFFIRGAVRYNSFQEKFLTDFLASFTLIPGTVLHLGYGSLYERAEWQNNKWLYRQGDFMNMRNGFFFKISYLWRIR